MTKLQPFETLGTPALRENLLRSILPQVEVDGGDPSKTAVTGWEREGEGAIRLHLSSVRRRDGVTPDGRTYKRGDVAVGQALIPRTMVEES